MQSFGEKIAKIGPADREIIVLRTIIKKERKKLTHAKYIVFLASLPSGLNKYGSFNIWHDWLENAYSGSKD